MSNFHFKKQKFPICLKEFVIKLWNFATKKIPLISTMDFDIDYASALADVHVWLLFFCRWLRSDVGVKVNN
jgi:hypothetical protein